MLRNEKELCEEVLLKHLEERGWTFIPGNKLEREDYEDPLLVLPLLRALKRINNASEITEKDLQRVIEELRLVPTGPEGAKKILNFYKFGVPVRLEKTRELTRIRLFDYEKPENNEFVVSRQVYNKGRESIRNDLLLYVNGIPLVNIECKDQTNLGVSWVDAYRQIKDYEQAVPELYKYVQIGVAAEAFARYFPIVPWQKEVDTQKWCEDGEDPLRDIAAMLSPETLLDILRHYFFYQVVHDRATKVIARYMQYRAGKKIVERVMRFFRGEDDKKWGLIWHWQGSGKTLTMIFAAHALYFRRELENPSIFFIVDRKELEDQLSEVFKGLDIEKPEIVHSVKELEEILRHDDYRGKRGIFIVLIYKFNPGELKGFVQELEEVSCRKETVQNRHNIIAFIDEAHRTQYGLLASVMRNIFKEAFLFAFTGTPIAKDERNTYLAFDYVDEEYLDRYFVTESIRDGFTVPIVYQPRLKELHLDEEHFAKFLKKARKQEEALREVPEYVREKVEGEIAQRIGIREFLENPKRIARIAQDIAEHFKENVDGRFKAMVVAEGRNACVLYKETLDKYLPPEYSEVVMTYLPDDQNKWEKVAEYQRKLAERYPRWDFETINKEIVRKFKEEELPKILIVTDMLITGFDAPILQTMYLDKFLREHRLLQALARVNRPYRELKEAGVVIDYVGIFDEFERAFENYAKEDIRDIVGDFSELQKQFEHLTREILSLFPEIPLEFTPEVLSRALVALTESEEREKKFVELYRKLQRVFELLGPDAIKHKYYREYQWTTRLYAAYRKRILGRPEVDELVRKFFPKTLEALHQAMEVREAEELPPVTFDVQYLERLMQVRSVEERAMNIVFTLNRLVLVERHKSPVYESLEKRVKRLIERWRERQKNYEEIYQEALEIFQEGTRLLEEKERLGLSDLEYSMVVTLREHLGSKKEGLVEEVRAFLSRCQGYMFPGWVKQNTARKEVEREVRRFVRGLKTKYNLSLEAIDRISAELFRRMEAYGV